MLNEKHVEGFGEEEVGGSSENKEYDFYHRIQKSKVAKALKRMRLGKALVPDGICIEL